MCDAVTGQGNGRATLGTPERANLFLVPLDDRRRWYRYHHLFADVLRARLLDEQPDDVPALHSRARAGALVAAGEFEGVEGRLRDAERWLDVTGSGAPSAEMIVADEAGFRSLPGAIRQAA